MPTVNARFTDLMKFLVLESIQSSIIPDLDHHGKMTKSQENATHTKKIISRLPAGDHKVAMNRQDSITKIDMKHSVLYIYHCNAVNAFDYLERYSLKTNKTKIMKHK